MRNFLESMWMALDAVRSNKLRSGLTLLSIAIGIFAIIGAGTAVTSLESTVNGQLASLGENTFQVRRTPAVIMSNAQWRKYNKRKTLSYAQAKTFTTRATMPEAIGYNESEGGMQIKSANLSTDPDVSVVGCNSAYLDCVSLTAEEGRSLNEQDDNLGRRVAIIGQDVAERLFPFGSPLGQEIVIKAGGTKQKGGRFVVIGVMKKRGSLLGAKLDNVVWIPMSVYTNAFESDPRKPVTITVKAESKMQMQQTMDETIGILRIIRNNKPGEDNDFEVETNETLTQSFAGFTGFLTSFGYASGIIALIAAGVGIMNIMLVSVKERTREIGIRKAIGARRIDILTQFIIEAITLCQLGGIAGILLGVIVGYFGSLALNFTPTIPWGSVMGSVITCILMGVVFGSYPAWKAAKLDPVETLRYE
jgi:putative ABC transport system permease protein